MTIAILIHALVFLAFWLTNLPFQETLNNFLVSATGQQMNFLLIFLDCRLNFCNAAAEFFCFSGHLIDLLFDAINLVF